MAGVKRKNAGWAGLAFRGRSARLTLLPFLMRAIVPRRMMNLSSSFAHRIADRQQDAGFVQSLRRCPECPAPLFVD